MTEVLWPLCRTILLTTLLWTGLISLLFAKNLAKNEQSVRVFLPPHNTCSAHVQKYEKHHAIPPGLLHAISKAESGLKDIKGRVVAWPWTINVRGQGYFYPTKQAAIAAVQALQARGIKSIDVGCMQVNLYYHPNAFKTLEDAFEPSKNVAYAAHFLGSLKKEHNCWHRAMAHYHSANPTHHIPYQKTVLRIWNQDRKEGGFSLAAGIFPKNFSTPKRAHIRRLKTGKTLKLASGLTRVSSRASVYRGIGENPSHVRRLKFSR